MILGKVALGFLGAAVVGGAMLCSDGFVTVRVNEHQPKGTHLHLVVPGALAPIGMKFVPREKMNEAERNVRPWLPAIRAAVDQIADYSDTTFVEVTNSSEHIRVSKVGASIVVDVEDPGETVHVSVPWRTIKSVLRELEEAGPSA
jgi:hypothetical protein